MPPAATAIRTNAKALSRSLTAYAGHVENPQGALEAIRRILVRQEGEVWATEGAALGVHWPAIVDEDRKTDPRMLVATGRLREAVAGSGAGTIDATSLTLGLTPDTWYGKFHQYGTYLITKRPFLGIAPENRALIQNVLRQRMEYAIPENPPMDA